MKQVRFMIIHRIASSEKWLNHLEMELMLHEMASEDPNFRFYSHD